MKRGSELEREQAVMKLYVMLLQSSAWARSGKGEGVADGLSSIVKIDLPSLLKQIANIVLRKDKHHSEHVSPSSLTSSAVLDRRNLVDHSAPLLVSCADS